jgi:N-dimethylarginine dimethylaminohydrolase
MSNTQFNVWSEFQPLSRAVVGNICGVEEIDIPFANQKHIDNLKTIFEYTFEDLEKVKTALKNCNIQVEQCQSFPLRGASPPLQPRDWFMVYGDTVISPLQNKEYNKPKSKSLDHIFDKQVQGDYIDTASFLRCGNDVFYSDDYGDQGTEAGEKFVCNTIRDINPNVNIHKVSECGAHLDGSIFFVAPGLMLTSIDKTKLPKCLLDWDIIDCDHPDAMQVTSANVWENLFKYKHKKFHPLIVEKWMWYKNANPEETCFSLNALSINEQCVMMPGYNQYVFNELNKRKIECINLDLKSLDFWDTGLHCFTNELNRTGECVDYFS